MYLEALHKNIKYCYLEGKQCRRLDLAINAVILLVRDICFERIIKISKQKRSSKILQIIASHNKSAYIKSDMILKVNGYTWMVNSQTDPKTKYIIEKINLPCNGCVLRCEYCKICVYIFKCSYMDNIIYLNIYKHIHAIAKVDVTIVQPSSNVNKYNTDENGKLRKEISNNTETNSTDLYKEINEKMEAMLGMHSRATLSIESQQNILKHCDKILTIISKETNKSSDNVPTKTTNIKHIEKQTRFYSNNRKKPNINPPLSSLESNLIRDSLNNSNGEVLNVHSSNDHSYF